MSETIKEKIIKILIKDIGTKNAAELTLDGWNFYKTGDKILELFDKQKKDLLKKIEKMQQTQEWVDFGENKLLRKQHQVGYNKALEDIKQLLK